MEDPTHTNTHTYIYKSGFLFGSVTHEQTVEIACRLHVTCKKKMMSE